MLSPPIFEIWTCAKPYSRWSHFATLPFMFHAISYFLHHQEQLVGYISGIKTHLKAVAYTEDRDAKFEDRGVDMRRVLVVDAVRRARQNHAYGHSSARVIRGEIGHGPFGLKLRSLIFWVHGMSSA